VLIAALVHSGFVAMPMVCALLPIPALDHWYRCRLRRH
jgi:hypothetical protein